MSDSSNCRKIRQQPKFILKQHENIYCAYPESKPVKNTRSIRTLYFEKLPDKFNRGESRTIAEKLNIVDKTAEKYLSDLVKAGLLGKDRHNSYYKIKA